MLTCMHLLWFDSVRSWFRISHRCMSENASSILSISSPFVAWVDSLMIRTWSMTRNNCSDTCAVCWAVRVFTVCRGNPGPLPQLFIESTCSVSSCLPAIMHVCVISSMQTLAWSRENWKLIVKCRYYHYFLLPSDNSQRECQQQKIRWNDKNYKPRKVKAWNDVSNM